jgi:hypothetical protein
VILLCGGSAGRMVTAPWRRCWPGGSRCSTTTVGVEATAGTRPLLGGTPDSRRAGVTRSDPTRRPGVWQRRGLLASTVSEHQILDLALDCASLERTGLVRLRSALMVPLLPRIYRTIRLSIMSGTS